MENSDIQNSNVNPLPLPPHPPLSLQDGSHNIANIASSNNHSKFNENQSNGKP